MFPVTHALRLILMALVALAADPPTLNGQSAQDKFYQAYYLEKAGGDRAAAAKLYAEVAGASGVSQELQAQAKARLAACQEDLVSVDFARLMPPNPLAYVEISRPGERVRKLVERLGLLADGSGAARGRENRLEISPAVIDALLGMRGVAVAVTGFDPTRQVPSGVVVFHPGDMELVRGLIETALPVASRPTAPIGGHPTYEVQGGVLVTLTARLVIVSTQESEIEGVVDRLKNPNEDSLATNVALTEVRNDRQDALMFFFVNPKPLMPILTPLIAAGATQSRELAVARALLDFESLRALSGCLDLSDQGLRMELTLRLDQGHHNLVYNFLRGPALDPATLKCVPRDAAAFVAFALNAAPASYTRQSTAPGDEAPIVTWLDVGREIFSNINGVAVFALPPGESAPQTPHRLPDIAAAITVNDPAKSQALWGQMLGIASLAGGAVTIDGAPVELEGATARAFRINKEVTIYLATTGNHLFLGSTREALARTVQTLRGDKSILDEPAFGPAISRIGASTTLAVCAHPSRCTELARPFMSAADAREAEPLAKLLTNTVATLMVTHSDQMLRLSLTVTGVPDVSGLVAGLIADQRRQGALRERAARAVREKDWNMALKSHDELLTARPHDAGLLRSKFDVLAAQSEDPAAASAVGDQILGSLHDDALGLNNFAWELLTEDRYQQRFDELALRVARRANEITQHNDWMLLDTLALAEYRAGNVQAAVELEEKALAQCRRAAPARVGEVEKALATFRAGAAE